MRRMLLTLSAVFAFVALAAPAHAQFKFGAQGAVITGVDDLSAVVSDAAKLSGTFGLGARTVFQPPALPIGVIGQGVYYFTDAVDYDYLTYSLAAQFRISTPIGQPLRPRRVAVASDEHGGNQQHRERSPDWRRRPAEPRRFLVPRGGLRVQR